MRRRTVTGPHTRQEHTVDSSPTSADQQCGRRSDPAIALGALYGGVDLSMLRTVPRTRAIQYWPKVHVGTPTVGRADSTREVR